MFQNGLRERFRDLHITPVNYGGGENNETLASKLCEIRLADLSDPEAIIGAKTSKPFDFSSPEGCARLFLTHAMECPAVLNNALEIASKNGVVPLSDAKPYSALTASKYARAVSVLNSQSETRVPTTHISLAILGEVVSTPIVEGLSIGEMLRYRKESSAEREAFLKYVVALQTKIGEVRQAETT